MLTDLAGWRLRPRSSQRTGPISSSMLASQVSCFCLEAPIPLGGPSPTRLTTLCSVWATHSVGHVPGTRSGYCSGGSGWYPVALQDQGPGPGWEGLLAPLPAAGWSLDALAGQAAIPISAQEGASLSSLELKICLLYSMYGDGCRGSLSLFLCPSVSFCLLFCSERTCFVKTWSFTIIHGSTESVTRGSAWEVSAVTGVFTAGSGHC